MRDGSDLASTEPKPKRNWFRRWQDWMDKPYKMGYTIGDGITAWFGVLVVLGIIAGLLIWVGGMEDSQNQRDCVLSYDTPTCLERRLKEARAKETYQKQLEEIKNGKVL